MLRNSLLIFSSTMVILCSLMAPLAVRGAVDGIEPVADPDEGRDYAASGFVKFRIKFVTALNSAHAFEGQSVSAQLMEDVKYAYGATLAPKGSTIFGRIEKASAGKRLIGSNNRYAPRAKRGTMVIRFDKVVLPNKTQIGLIGRACPQDCIFSNGSTVREIIVGQDGQLVKSADVELAGRPDLGIAIPQSWIKMKDRKEVDVHEGDQLIVEADLNSTTVAGQVIKK